MARIPIDAHVHVYDAFGWQAALDAAAGNFRRYRPRPADPGEPLGILLLTDTARAPAFAELLEKSDDLVGWKLEERSDPGFRALINQESESVWVMAGRQIITDEGLEVLALATDAAIADGVPLRDCLAAVNDTGGIAVLPWGFGKWIGPRGNLVKEWIGADRADADFALLGDNGGRPQPAPDAPVLVAGRQARIPVLCGSDPLPLASGADRVGAFGSWLEIDLQDDRPVEAVRRALRALSETPDTFGSRVGWARFARDQIGLRLAKFAGGSKSGLAHDTETPDVETASDDYARRFSGAVGTYLLEVQTRAVERLLKRAGYRSESVAEPLRVLEVGGGHGQLTGWLLDQGFDVTVQGSNEDCSVRIQPLIDAHPERCRFLCSSLLSLPVENDRFDLVIAIRLMAHVERTDELLREMARVSKKGVLVDFPPLISANLAEPLLFQVKRLIEGNTRPFFIYRTGDLKARFAAEGLDEAQVTKQFALPMVVHRKLKKPSLSARLEGMARAVGLTAALGAPVLMLAEKRA
ncbi:MAG: class I SAM-dependent methyltransferase [Geminicoccaceae bacterium]